MSQLDPQLTARLEQALGTGAVASLRQRGLLRTVDVAGSPLSDSTLVAGRVAGTVSGLALGDSLVEWARHDHDAHGTDQTTIKRWLTDVDPTGSVDRVTAVTQLFVLSAEAWLGDGLGAPASIADDLAARAGGLRSPGRAVRHAVRHLQEGTPWFEAASGSYGDAMLPRAVAAGLATIGEPRLAGITGSLDASVTHASKAATLCGAMLAGLVVALVNRPAGTDWRRTAHELIASVDHDKTRALLDSALQRHDAPPVGDWLGDVRPHAAPMLAVAIWAQQSGDDPSAALHAAWSASNGNRSAVAVAGALFGAIHGIDALPPRHRRVEGADHFRVLAERLTAATPATGSETGSPTATPAGADIWFLVDRSGSMSSIARDVVTGFERFFADQRALSGDATVTVVQFDDEAPDDVIIDARPVDEVRSIRDRFQPRGMTPLYDAVGLILDRAEARRGAPEDQLVVIFTDGMENASHQWTRDTLFRRVNRLRALGWTFVFLGANQDSYETGHHLAMPAGNVSNFRADADGVAATYLGLSRTVGEWRSKGRHERRRDADEFWGGVKEAEQQ